MSAAQHNKLEHFLIHVVAVLFLFSSISAGFLGYGVYQNSEKLIKPQTLVQPKVTKAAGSGPAWGQDNWTGGAESSTVTNPYDIDWNSSGSWSKYNTATNVTVDSNGVKDDGTSTGILISSIFDLGSKLNVSLIAYGASATIEVKSGDTPTEVQSAGWTSGCQSNKRYVQYKLSSMPIASANFGNQYSSIIKAAYAAGGSPSSNYVTTVSFAPGYVSLSGKVTDASTGSAISGATVSYGGANTTTVLNYPSSSPFVREAYGALPPPGQYSFSFIYDPNKSSYSVTASASGYQTQTKTVTPSGPGGCGLAKSATQNFALSKVSSSNSSSNTSTSDSNTTSEPSVSTSTFQSTKLPSIFTTKGSTTTDLSKIADPKRVKNFILDIPGKNKIVFKETLDLSGGSTVAALKELDKYVLMDKPGIIDFDSKTLEALNKKATLTMYSLKHVFEPEVLVDGKRDTKKVVSNTNYDKKAGTLSFDVSHFTVFTAVPKLVLLSPTTAIIKSASAVVTASISDPNATVTGTFNEVKLAKITPDQKTGEFTLEKLTFKEGKNTLKLEAESSIGKVVPLETTITYAPTGIVPTKNKPLYQTAGFLYAALSAIAIALVLGYLVYRRRKRHEKLKAKSTEVEKPK